MSRTANLRIWAATQLGTVAAAMLMVSLGFTNPAQAAFAGDLDESFDCYGKVVFDDFGGVNDNAEGVAIQPDGKIVLAGFWCGFAAGCHTCTFALARYNPDGSLDTTFSGGVRTSFDGAAWAKDVAIQADGRIVAAGSAESYGGDDNDFAIARYHAITDNTPPDTTITSGPSGPINSTSVTYTFVSSGSGSKFQCNLDGYSFSGCSSPKSYSNLTEGSHFFEVRAIDSESNTDLTPAQRSFTVDTKAPRVISVFPTEDATGVARSVNVQATFSEEMRASSINTTTVQLFRTGTTIPRAAVVRYDAQTKTATLNPESDLRLGTNYKAVVTTATMDLAGNRLDQGQDPANGNQPKKWFFTVSN